MLQLFQPRFTAAPSSSPSIFRSIFGHSTTNNDAKENGDILSLTLAGNHKVGFEDVLYIIKQKTQKGSKTTTAHVHPCRFWLINTLPGTEQDVLISHTIPAHAEEEMINQVLHDFSKNPRDDYIVLYGKNNTDDTVDRKHKTLVQLGFSHVFVYYGGLFEWTLLQDVYGSEHFPTTTKTVSNDLLYWAPSSKLTLTAATLTV